MICEEEALFTVSFNGVGEAEVSWSRACKFVRE
jgi:hypothetical protein